MQAVEDCDTRPRRFVLKIIDGGSMSSSTQIELKALQNLDMNFNLL